MEGVGGGGWRGAERSSPRRDREGDAHERGLMNLKEQNANMQHANIERPSRFIPRVNTGSPASRPTPTPSSARLPAERRPCGTGSAGRQPRDTSRPAGAPDPYCAPRPGSASRTRRTGRNECCRGPSPRPSRAPRGRPNGHSPRTPSAPWFSPIVMSLNASVQFSAIKYSMGLEKDLGLIRAVAPLAWWPSRADSCQRRLLLGVSVPTTTPLRPS